ncbi:MAG: HEAT repeat domain-containing protein [Verrucomicrobia bacterium]|nr:HEAT repeat domain-containing protein [Verrucomicrobiota bacterium]
MRPIAFNGIKNDVLDVILRQNTLPEGIGAILVEMYRDESYDDMWRDYCVQFMTAYYEVKWPADAPSPTDGGNAEDKERETIEAVYWDALKETDTTIAGTALLGLNSLSQQYAAIDPKRVSQAAIDLLINSEVGEPARITAFSIAASLGDRQALPEARAIAQTGETITLRMAAIAAIGRLGTAKDLELLSALEQDDETRIRRIAETALKRAQRRLEHASTTAQAPQEATLNTSSLEASTD